MFKIKFTLFFFFVFNFAQAQEGIQFLHSFEEAMAQAQKENKLIFMDAYTTWCGPCKMLNRNTFPNAEVGKFYNKNFVNLKMDMEKGEGPALAKKYGVRVYPTLLFIDRFGKTVHQAAGYRGPKSFIELGKKAGDPSKNIAVLANRFEKGDRNPKFLLDYSQVVFDANKGGHEVVASEFLKTQKNWNTETNLKYIFKMIESVDSPMFEYLTQNQDKFKTYYPAAQVKGRIEQTIYATIYSLGENPDLNKVDAIFAKAYPQMAGQMSARYRMRHFVENEEPLKFVEVANNYVKKYKPTDWDELNEMAWNVYESVDDRKSIKKAVKWTKKSMKIEKNIYNSDTLAALYYKLGKKRKALRAAKKGIKLAKAAGDDYSSTTNLIREIEKL